MSWENDYNETMRKLKISDEAADCLAWFVNHPYYGGGKDISTAIIELSHEWFLRDETDQEWIKGSFDALEKGQKR